MRPRSQTIGTLGRSPARATRPPPTKPPTEPPVEPPPPEKGAVGRWIHGALLDNIGLKFLSMVLSVTVFLLVNTDKEREITVRLGVKYDYPADKVLVSEQLDEVRVTIKGAWRRLREFDERELGRVRLDLRNAPTAGDIAITHDLITNLPPGLTVTSVSPRTVRVQFDKRVEKLVEVTPIVTGRPQHGYVVAEIKAVPATAVVRGGERLLNALTSVRTSGVPLEGRTDNFDALAELTPPSGVEVDPTQRIAVHVRIDEELVTRRFSGLPVVLRGDGVDPARWKVVPAQIEVSLTGARLAVEKAKGAMIPFVKLLPGDKRREATVEIQGLPPGVGIRIYPERVKLTPVRPVRAPNP
jgi:YbbR domain-containing protein